MSGFIAMIAHQRDQRVSEADIQPLADAYQALRGPATRHTAQAGSFARLVTFDTASAVQPGILRAGDSWAAAAGLVYGRGTLLDTPLAQLDGQFGLIRYNAGADEVIVATDPFGMRAIFVATRNDITFVSTSALALAVLLQAAPDRLALLTFLRTGSHFGALTNWQGIKRMEPGTALRFSAAGRSCETYWRVAVNEQVRQLSFRQTVDYCIGLLTQTYRDALGPLGPLWSDLTGGYDSRLLNLVLARAGVDFHTNTTGDPQHVDVRIAREIAAAAGWDWTNIALPADWPEHLLHLLPTSLGWSDSHLDAVRLTQVLWTHAEKGQRLPVLLSGGGHEHFSGRQWLHVPFTAGRTTQLDIDGFINVLFMGACNTTIFAADPTARVLEDVRYRLLERAAPYADDLDTVKYNLLASYKQMGHHGAYASAAAGQLSIGMPAFCKPIFTTAISISPQYRNRHRLMRAMIERLDPRIAALNTHAGSPAQTMRLQNLHRFIPYYTTLGRKAVMHASSRYLHHRLFAPAPAFNNRVIAARRVLLDQLNSETPFVHANLRSAALYDPQRLDVLLRSAYAPEFTQNDLLGRIITVELALRAVDTSVVD